jgi:hypothetical protein
VVRLLRPDDVDRLMVLERAKWTSEQATGQEEMLRRIEVYPMLSIGAFSVATGEALVSLFLKPITDEALASARTWADSARIDDPVPTRTRSVFGISLSSSDADAADAVDRYLWPILLKGGWRDLYLGSPLPGLRAWRRTHPSAPVEEYVYQRRNGVPRDPQLRYYHGRGFTVIEGCRPDYFPHEASLNYGALIRRPLVWSAGAPLWRRLPLPWLFTLTGAATAFA